MATWPATLPQTPLLDNYEEGADSCTLRSTVDVGLAKLRPRYTAEVKTFSISLMLTDTQVAALETFYTATLGFGSDAFTWIHPRTLTSASMRFRSRPSYGRVSGGYSPTNFMVEMLP